MRSEGQDSYWNSCNAPRPYNETNTNEHDTGNSHGEPSAVLRPRFHQIPLDDWYRRQASSLSSLIDCSGNQYFPMIPQFAHSLIRRWCCHWDKVLGIVVRVAPKTCKCAWRTTGQNYPDHEGYWSWVLGITATFFRESPCGIFGGTLKIPRPKKSR